MGDKRQKNNDKYEDITSYSKPKGITKGLSHFMRYKFKPFFLRNHKRNLKALLSIVICLVLVFSALGGAYIRKILSLINYETVNRATRTPPSPLTRMRISASSR